MNKISFSCLLLGAVIAADLLGGLAGCSRSKQMPDLSKVDFSKEDLNDIADKVTAALNGFEYTVLTVGYSGNVHEGTMAVDSQDPKAGASIDPKAAVSVLIAPAGIRVPSVKGRSLAEASAAIINSGLQWGGVTGDPVKFRQSVLSTTPEENSLVAKGTPITFNMPASDGGITGKLNLDRFAELGLSFLSQYHMATPTPRPSAVSRPGPTGH